MNEKVSEVEEQAAAAVAVHETAVMKDKPTCSGSHGDGGGTGTTAVLSRGPVKQNIEQRWVN